MKRKSFCLSIGSLLFCFYAVLMTNREGSAEFLFYSRMDLVVGHYPSPMTSGDFDGDGRLDIAAANEDGDSISILLGRGNGSFRPSFVCEYVDTPRSMAVGDLNEDGHPDLAVASYNEPGCVSVLLGHGDGSFQFAVTYPANSNPISVAIGDFDGDGHQDIAAANYSSDDVSILIGNGDGSFHDPVRYDAGYNPRSAATGDFNADGHRDISVANLGSDSVSILLGLGDGSFQSPLNHEAGHSPCSVAVGDFNLDGKDDVAAANHKSEEENVTAFLGNGDGTLQEGVKYDAGYRPCSIAAGDFDGDGVPDLAVANIRGDEAVSIFIGNGDGSFREAVHYGNGYPDYSDPCSIVLSDLNGDGDQDIVVVNSGMGNLSFFLGKEEGLFKTPMHYGVASTPYSAAVDDFNEDGHPDVVAVNYYDNAVTVLINLRAQCRDDDGDGHDDDLCGGEDCDDADIAVNPETEESQESGNCFDGVDNDCDGLVDADPECSTSCAASATPSDMPLVLCLVAAPALILLAGRLFSRAGKIRRAAVIRA